MGAGFAGVSPLYLPRLPKRVSRGLRGTTSPTAHRSGTVTNHQRIVPFDLSDVARAFDGSFASRFAYLEASQPTDASAFGLEIQRNNG